MVRVRGDALLLVTTVAVPPCCRGRTPPYSPRISPLFSAWPGGRGG